MISLRYIAADLCHPVGKFCQNTYSQYEIGVLNYPVDVIIKLAELYGVSTDYLFGLTNKKQPYPKK